MNTTTVNGRQWELFVDWCAATDHRALPAAGDTVLEFLVEVAGGPATVRRRLEAIDTAHLAVGHPPPTSRLETVGPPPPPRFPADLVGTALATTPIGGWPVGLAGRRNAALLAVVCAGGLTRRQALVLTTRSAPDQLVPTVEPPGSCPACALRRWQHTRAAVEESGWRHVRTELAEQGEITGSDLTAHDCHPATISAPVPGLPVGLFCPINRRGVPELRQRLTTRAVTAVIADSLHRARHLASAPADGDRPDQPWTETDRARAGAARRQAGERLAAIESTLAEAEDYADAILDRVAAALGDTTAC